MQEDQEPIGVVGEVPSSCSKDKIDAKPAYDQPKRCVDQIGHGRSAFRTAGDRFDRYDRRLLIAPIDRRPILRVR